MGKYATTTSISLILPGFLKNNTTTSDTEGTNIFSKFIDNAEAKVDSAIAHRYDLTGFTSGSIPPLLIKLTEDIAVFNVIRATNFRADDRSDFMDDYQSAIDTLEKLEKGKINLTYTDGSSVAVLSTSRILSSTENYTPIFGLDDQTEWQRDEDEEDDQSDARG